jgi:hypothetical protein
VSGWQIADEPYQHWIEQVELASHNLLSAPQSNIEDDPDWPRISIIMPTYNSPLEFLQKALDSVLAQSYPKWQLCIADDASDNAGVLPLLKHYAHTDSRIVVTHAETNGGIALTSNKALELASGQYIAFMDHDDTLCVHAMLLVAEALRAHSATQILYSDSDSINTADTRSNPFFKPNWNYDLFLAQNYLNHLTVYKADLIRQIGGLREGFEGSQDYDLALRAIERTHHSHIRHVPQILYHWRVVPSAVSQTNLGDAVRSGRRAVTAHLQRSQLLGSVTAPANALLFNQISWAPSSAYPRVQIVVYGHDNQMIEASITSIKAITQDADVTVIGVICKTDSEPASLAALLNTQCSDFTADYVCFIAAGLIPQSPQWLLRLTGFLNRDDVGVVAPKIVDAQGTILSGPLLLGIEHWFEGILPARFSQTSSRSNDGYFKRLRLDHQVSAVPFECLILKRSLLEEAGGINATWSSLPLLGADLCLKVRAMGYATIWTASVKVQCLELAVKSTFLAQPKPQEIERFEKTWHETKALDPHYNPNLGRGGKNFQLPR